MAATAVGGLSSFDTLHQDMIHDAQMDYYGKRIATCSSDKLVKIFNVSTNPSDGSTNQSLVATLSSHEGPVWQVAWSHPKFGSLLASCSYDSKVYIWKEGSNGQWSKIKEHALHSASVNAISWAPHEYGLILACASSDGKLSILTYQQEGSWDLVTLPAHSIGVNSVSWMPAVVPGSLFAESASASESAVKRLASGGCDNVIKIWKEEDGSWKEETLLQGHSDWVRDVAFAPNLGVPRSYLASCSQDKTVIIWTKDPSSPVWAKKVLGTYTDGTPSHTFTDVIWRVSWSLAGNLLAVSCGDNKITLWKEAVNGDWVQVGDAANAQQELQSQQQQQ